MSDNTELGRRLMAAEIAGGPDTRAALEAEYGTVWSTDELTRDFEVLGFLAPYVVVRRKADGVKGSLMFRHSPRFYFGFRPD